jgi:hypothetical protein
MTHEQLLEGVEEMSLLSVVVVHSAFGLRMGGICDGIFVVWYTLLITIC